MRSHFVDQLLEQCKAKGGKAKGVRAKQKAKQKGSAKQKAPQSKRGPVSLIPTYQTSCPVFRDRAQGGCKWGATNWLGRHDHADGSSRGVDAQVQASPKSGGTGTARSARSCSSLPFQTRPAPLRIERRIAWVEHGLGRVLIVTDDELDQLFEEARENVWQAKQSQRS